MMSCPACAAPNLVHDDLASLTVCTECGTVVDASLPLLHENHSQSTHKLLRNAKGWHLARTKQDRDRKNTIAMTTFISAVLSKLNNPGLSPRAEAIFVQAMTKGGYRWGRKAKLTAGAAIAIALREARKSDSLRDIAFFLDDSPVSLARAFQSVVSLLDFSLASTDPTVHLPILREHLQSVMKSDPEFPLPLFFILMTLSLDAVVRTATSLSHIISHHTPPLPLVRLPTPPTACALLILGLEAEVRTQLPYLKDLSRALAARFALSPGVVSSRYKILYDLIEEWIRDVPWLDQFEYKGQGRGIPARSKVAKRAIVARGIKDVVQFHQEIWSRRMQRQQKVSLVLESDSDQDQDQDQESPNIASSSKKTVSAPNKRSKKKSDATQAAYQLLRDPLSSRSLDVATFSDGMSMLSHLLTCSPDELARARGSPPTRLQLLAAFRGGSTPEHIADEELFAEGELEGLLRTEQEREALLPLFQLNWGEEISGQEASASQRKPVTETKRGAKRVDMDALARLLGGVDDEELEDAVFQDSDDVGGYSLPSAEHQTTAQGTEIVSDWRPASPDDDDMFVELSEDRYEEEI